MNLDLPHNLYCRKGRFVYRHKGREYPLGRDMDAAIREAKATNTALANEAKETLRSVLAHPERTLGILVRSYVDSLKVKGASKRTIWGVQTMERAISSIADSYVGPSAEDAANMTAKLYSVVQRYESEGKARSAQWFRSRMIQVFRHAASMGWTSINPARELPKVTVEVKRSRLTWGDFQKIYAEAQKMEPWVCRSMELALVTLQRRGDVARMRRDHIKDGYLHVEQEKTGAKIRIPLGLKLNVLGKSLDELLRRRLDVQILTRSLVFHTSHNGRAKPGNPVHPQSICRAFAAARDMAGITYAGSPPTFHELRSLGIRLYQAQGFDPQVLAGHKDAATTAVYKDDRGAEWKEVAI